MSEIKERIENIERSMQEPNFWDDKAKAQDIIKELNELKDKLSGLGKYDKGGALLTLFSGAGGDDAEDWTRILFDMYSKYIEKKGWSLKIIHKHEGAERRLPAGRQGYKNITFEVTGSGAYGKLKKEQGVHRLVRISPFSAKKLRHTSFALLEVVPVIVDKGDMDIPEKDIRYEFARSSGAGGQNVNKRETAVRVVHIPTKLAVHCETERSQAQNKERALNMLRAKIYKLIEDEKDKEMALMKISKEVSPEWGSQIRSYVFHPYKLVKDHRTGVEERDVEKVLDGGLDEFIEAEQDLATSH
ncbi:MAG: PCRF domain-containing protein [Parcubacteria group bacterium]|nr:PCRF domain-containing protein [Parcubacteria group bacterium]MCR4342726.1 PCRF domain-containing protein [Patescibacteria group bacterium]